MASGSASEDGHHEWCDPVLCGRQPPGVHVSSTVVSSDRRLLMYLEMCPDDMPHLVIMLSDAKAGPEEDPDSVRMLRVPLNLLRGFLLGVAWLTGKVEWLEDTQPSWVERLTAAYRGADPMPTPDPGAAEAGDDA